jgi:Cu-Zn family superoxide dismutase
VRRHQQVLTSILATRIRGGPCRAHRGCARAARPRRSYGQLALVAALAGTALLAACDNIPSSLRIIPEAGTMAVARLEPKNGSTVRGTITFTQRGSRVWISANITELFPGPHSLYIHTVGNCSSINAASAGPVWNVVGAAPGDKRTGDLPQIYAGTEGNALLQTSTPDLSVGTGAANDVVGHSVIVHQGLDPDPKAEFGVRNGWLACGVLERSQGLDLKKLL